MADQDLSIEISARDLTGQAFEGVRRQLESLNQTSAQTAKGVGDLSGGVEKLGSFFKAAGIGAAIGTAVNELVKYHGATRQAAAAIADQAEQLQRSTSEFQSYIFAADQVGVSQEKVVATLSRFSVRIGDAVAGKKEAIAAFDRLGVKLLDVNGKLRNQDDILADTAAALLRLGNANERASAANDILGVSGARLIPLLRQLAGGMGDLMDRAERSGTIIDDKAVQAANRLANQSNETSLAIRAFYANIGMPIELKWLELVETTVKKITSAYLSANDAAMKFLASGATVDLDRKIAGVDKKIASAEGNLQNPTWLERQLRTPQSEQVIRDEIAAYRVDRERLVTEKAKIDEQYRKYTATREGSDLGRPAGAVDWAPDTSLGGRMPAVKGSGGAGARDRIQEAINQLEGQTLAAQQALRRMMAGAGTPLKDLEQQVELEKKIADEIAKLGRYDPNDPRVKQIREQVIAHEQAESALKRWSAAAKDAEEIERRSGDGTAFLAGEMRRLNEALDTGRLSYAAYGEAARIAKEKAQDMALQLRGQQGGIEGLAAGMEYAARQWQRNNSTFQQGQRIFESSVDAMNQALNEWVSTGELNFQKFLGSFLSMIAQMELKAAATSLWSAISGIGGGGGSGGIIGALLGLGGSGASSSIGSGIGDVGNMIGGFGFFADGGRPPVGQPSIVGERGWEVFMPDQPGTIFNQDQLAGMGGGNTTVIVNQSVYVGEYVTSTEFRKGLGAMKDAAEQGAMARIIDDRRRGGRSTKGAFK